MELMEKLEYTLIGYVNRSKIYAELDTKVVKVVWYGVVDGQTAREVLNLAGDLISEKICDKLILDRTDLRAFTKDAKQVIKKEFLLNRAPKLAKYVKKIATITSKHNMGASIGGRITESIANLFPYLNIQRFETIDTADDWILDTYR